MPESHPSRLSRVFLLFIQLLLLSVLLFALYVNSWREGLAVLPDIEYYLERKASVLLGVDVDLQGTKGYFIGLKPHIRVASIQVREANVHSGGQSNSQSNLDPVPISPTIPTYK